MPWCVGQIADGLYDFGHCAQRSISTQIAKCSGHAVPRTREEFHHRVLIVATQSNRGQHAVDLRTKRSLYVCSAEASGHLSADRRQRGTRNVNILLRRAGSYTDPADKHAVDPDRQAARQPRHRTARRRGQLGQHRLG